MPRAALFLDRDGTLIRHIPYLHKPEEVELLPGAREAVARARDLGYLLFMHTNQSGIGRGMFTHADAEACNRRMLEVLGLGEDIFTDACMAPEAPEHPIVYRKPSPRFALEMGAKHGLELTRSWMIGDNATDIETAFASGLRAVALAGDYLTAEHAAQWRAAGKEVIFFTSLKAFVDTLPRA